MDWLCRLAAAACQFGFVALFAFLVLDALQMYGIATNVIAKGGFLRKKHNQAIAWSGAGAVTLLTTLVAIDNVPSIWTCWLNFGHVISTATVLPLLLCAIVAFVLAEAAGIDKRPRLPTAGSRQQRRAAWGNRTALLVLIPLNVAAWLLGSLAIYHFNLYLFSTVLFVNVSLGVAIFLLHTLGNPVIHGWFIALYARLRRSTGGKPTTSPSNSQLYSHRGSVVGVTPK